MTRFTPLAALALMACMQEAPMTDTRVGVSLRATEPLSAGARPELEGVTGIQFDVRSIEGLVDDEWVSLIAEPQHADLMLTHDGTIDELDAAIVPPGHYTQVRVLLADDNAIILDDEAYPLRVPSGGQSGLKIPLNADIESGNSYELTLAFEVERNLVYNAQGWQLKPVVQAESLVQAPIETEPPTTSYDMPPP